MWFSICRRYAPAGVASPGWPAVRRPAIPDMLDVSGGRCVRRQAVDQLLGRIQSRGDQVVSSLPEHHADQRYVAALGRDIPSACAVRFISATKEATLPAT